MLPHLVIDGYSLLHQDPLLKRRLRCNLEQAREKLVRRLEGLADALADRVTVVFDGQRGGVSPECTSSMVEVLFSPSNKTADTVIEQLVAAAGRPGCITVVTSDSLEQHTVTAAGAECMSCAQFLEWCGERQKQVQTQLARPPQRTRSSTLGDYFPDPG